MYMIFLCTFWCIFPLDIFALPLVRSATSNEEHNFLLMRRKELKSTMHQLGEKMSDYEIDMIIREADLDRDGRVNYHEFVRVVAKKY